MLRRRGRPPYPGPLTPAEARVLQFVRDGMPNAEIAVRLGVSVNTVRYHVSNLLAKADVESREKLAEWRPRSGPARRWLAVPALGLPAKIGLGAIGALLVTGMAAGLALNVVERSPEAVPEIASPPEGYERPTAADLEARGFIDAGLLFVPLEAESPLLGVQLREGFTAVKLTGGVRLNLGVDPEHWRDTGFVVSGVNDELIGTAGGYRYVLQMASARNGNAAEGSPTLFDHPAGSDAFISSSDGQPEFTMSVHRTSGSVYNANPYGSAQHAAAMDDRGHLFISREPVPTNLVVDEWTGRVVDKSGATPAGQLGEALAGYPFTSCSEQGTGVSSLAVNSLRLPTRCSVSLRTALHLYAPTAGVVSCESQDVLLLTTPEYALRFTWANTGYGGPPDFDCAERTVAVGAIIGPNRHYVITATGLDGQDLAVGATLDLDLYVGDFGLPASMECPCRWGH